MLKILTLFLLLLLNTAKAAVNLDNGTVTLHFQDLILKKAPEKIVFSRTYNSNEASPSLMGKGMALKLASRLVFKPNEINFYDYGLNNPQIFTPGENNIWRSPTFPGILTKKNNQWSLENDLSTLEFDERGQLLTLTSEGETFRYEWKEKKLNKVTDHKGSLLFEVEMDDNGLITQLKGQNGDKSLYFYNNQKQLIKHISPSKDVFEYSYGPYGLTLLQQNGSPLLKVTYAKTGRVHIYEEVGHRKTTLQEKIKKTQDGEIVTFIADIKEGQQQKLITRTNAYRLNKGSKVLISKKEVEKVGTKENIKEIEFSEKFPSRPIKLVLNGTIQEISYDEETRPIEIKNSAQGVRKITYQKSGELKNIQENGQIYNFTYFKQRLQKVEGPNDDISLSFSGDHLQSMTYQAGKKNYKVIYDNEGRITTLYDAGKPVLELKYDKQGAIKDMAKYSAQDMDKLMLIRNKYEYYFVELPRTNIPGHF
jgi:YD repeat-containing protein